MTPVAPTYVYRARLARIIDGDTFVLLVDLGFHVSTTKTIRLRDVNAAEPGTPAGTAATAFVLDLLAGKPLLVQSYKDRRSFARWVADVWLDTPPEPESVADHLVKAGHATAVQYRPIADSPARMWTSQ